MKGLFRSTLFWMVIVALLLPFVEMVLPREWRLANLMRPVFILAVLGLGLNIVTGFTGLLNLGIAAFMAIGAYSYAILSCEIFPFQLGFWLSALGAAVIGGVFGLLLGLPTLRLRGDYLAIVTLGFGEIVQDVLRNLDVITRGTQGINPLPPPALFGIVFTADSPLPWYYLFLALLSLLVILSLNLEHSRIGRNWTAIREDELAASCMGVNTTLSKLLAFSLGAALAGFAGALWAAYLGSSGEPGNYDFQVSILALCMLIVGGMGSVLGVLLGAVIMVGFNSIVLVKISDMLARMGFVGTGNVFLSPNNWKYLIFGLALVLMMRFRPEGFLPSKRMRAELHDLEEQDE